MADFKPNLFLSIIKYWVMNKKFFYSPLLMIVSRCAFVN